MAGNHQIPASRSASAAGSLTLISFKPYTGVGAVVSVPYPNSVVMRAPNYDT